VKKLVSVINSQSLVRVSGVLVGKLVSMVLEEKGVKGREVDIVFVDDGRITGLNKMYLRKNRPTDVIAFGFEGGGCGEAPEKLLGDVVVSTERAFFRAGEFGKDVPEEICLYVIHGLLHLLGFDDGREADARRMRREEERMLAKARERFGNGFFRKAIRVA